MPQHKVVFTTERGERHQQAALEAAPDNLSITMLRQPDRATLLSHLAEADYFISERIGAVDAEMIEAAPNLKLILRLGLRTYDIDIEAAKAAGVVVCYWPVGTVIRVAEHLILQMLTLSKKIREVQAIALAAGTEWGESKRTDEDTFAYNWSNRENVDGLWNKTIGIMGLGEMGSALVQRLQNWDCTLLYSNLEQLPKSVENSLNLTYVDADTLFRQSDYIVNTLPYFSNTNLMINAEYFNKMKDGAFLVSCGSGSVINEADLAEAIKSGKLGGAALDTYEWEPIKADNPMIALAQAGYNVLLTPHIAAGATAAEASERIDDYSNISKHIAGQPLRYRVA